MPLLEEEDLCRPFSSPLWAGERGGGNHGCSDIPASLSLAEGGGNIITRGGEADPDGPIWRDGAFRRDTWTKVDAKAALPDGAVIVPKARWLAERDELLGRNTPLGLLVTAGERIDDIAGDLARFALIALDFPKFSDGRAFSTARLLREKYGYAGELRAVGDVLADQIPLMRRVGFTVLEVKNGPTRRALAEGRLAEVKLHYQPAGGTEPPAGTRPWLRHTPNRP
jgi:uncharacterized protein (DUF934 family)